MSDGARSDLPAGTVGLERKPAVGSGAVDADLVGCRTSALVRGPPSGGSDSHGGGHLFFGQLRFVWSVASQTWQTCTWLQGLALHACPLL